MTTGRPAVRRGSRIGDTVRLAALLAAAVAFTRPLFTGRFVGGTDARWYASVLQDFLGQLHSGHFPVFVGQTGAWNGGIHPFRSAPLYLWLGAVWDLVTLHRLGIFALQHLTAITCAAAGAAGFYAAAVSLVPTRRWEAMFLAVLYVGAPAWLSIMYGSDAYMTFMALATLPLALYGNARSLLFRDGSGYPQLAGGLVLLWTCHPPVALLATLATLLLQGGLFLLEPPPAAACRAAVEAVLLFAALGAYYFVSMSGLPSRPGTPSRDGLQLGGLALALIGLVMGVLRRRGWRWLLLGVPAGIMLGLGCLPWLGWMLATAALTVVAALAAKRIFGFDPAQRVPEILFPALLVAAGLAQAWLGPVRPERNLASLAGLSENTAQAAGFFLPVLPQLSLHSNYQPGLGLWLVLAILGFAFFRTRSAAVKLFFIAGVLPVLAIVRVPWVSDFLVGYFPRTLAAIVNFPLVLRLVPVMSAFIAMGGVVWLAAEPPGVFGRAGPFLLLAGAAGWCLAQGIELAGFGRDLVATRQASTDYLRSENVFTPHFDYDLLPIPSYFWEGVVDPRLEFRLREPDGRVFFGPDDVARRMEAEGARRLELVAHSVRGERPEWLQLEPELTLAPGEHVLLRFRFEPGRDFTGWLIFQSEHGFRQYHLPDAGLAHGFGTAPERSHVISLWNSGSTPEHYRLRMIREQGNDLTDGSKVAEVAVSEYRDGLNPVRIQSWDRLRATVVADRLEWVETPRVFLPGYAATLDGHPIRVFRSSEKLAMVRIPPGRHVLMMRYLGTPMIWLAFAVSLAAWTGWLGSLWLRRSAAEGARELPEAGSFSEEDAASVARLRLWIGRAALVLAGALVLGFYSWTIATSGGSFQSADAHNQYYNQLTAGFREGHLYMDAPVDPALLALPANHRPGNAPYLLDASLYRGHYYLYFGVTPVVALFWPYAALTGHLLPEPAAAGIFAAAGFLLAAAWWLGVRRRRFPRLGGAWAALGVLAIGICSAAPSALRRPMFYEVAILSGYAFTMLALCAVTEARFRPRFRKVGLAVAGLAAGLAVGSRANLLPAEAMLLLIGIAGASSEEAGAARRRLLLSGLAVAGLGFGAVGAGLAAYNYARFGDVLEFGHRYQLGMNPHRVFHVANFIHNLRGYYLSPPALNGYFPFVAPRLAPPPPPDYIGHEHVHGEWIWLPLAALALAAAAAGWRKRDRNWSWAVVIVLPVFAINFLIVGSVGFRANRYMLDFQPALVLATLCALAPTLAGGGPWSALARYCAGAGLAVAIAFNMLASIQVQGFFPLVAPAEYHRLAGIADRLVWPWLRGEAAQVGDREIDVRWPKTEAGLGSTWQPILATSTAGFDDVLWIAYDGGNRGQFIYQHGEYGSVFGDWFPLPLGGVSRMRISGAFLLPAPGHPWYGDRPSGEQEALKRRLRVWVDGELRLDRDVPSYDASPSLQRWGVWRAADTAVTYRFSGGLGRPSVAPVDGSAARELAQASGPVRLVLLLPRDRYGTVEPLLQTGPAGAFDTVAVRYVAPGWVRLLHDSLGAGADESEPIAVDYSRPQRVEIETPVANNRLRWTAGGPVPTRAAPRLIRVWWNGRLAFESKIPPHPASPDSIAVGGSSRKSSQARLLYSGLLRRSPRLEPLGPAGPGLLQFRTPQADTFEDARGVLIRFDRADGESALVAWRHAGSGVEFGWSDADGGRWSRPLSLGGSSPLRLAISPPISPEGVVVASPDVTPYETIRLQLGGTEVLSAETDMFSGGAVRASSLLPEHWSRLGAAPEPGSQEAPPGLPGRIRIRFYLPPPFSGGQPLLEAGRPVAADSIYLRRLADGRFVLGLDHWLSPATESAPIALAPGDPHTLLIELGSLLSSRAVSPDLVRLTLDGRVVLQARIPLYRVKPGEVSIGRNPLGMSTSDPEFRGEIVSVRTHQPAAP